ncbi:MAG: ESPR-type extended signal peptide-containing protein [Veillonella sp.]|nr:ESPR-type extended signal peptide-containing protein [Veillonella sp.]MDU5682308.1 ESPR-type extended signal peptide-containing protein [Veillonella sp.]MDU5835223.1 ESPR-type extended signal peptide-containing protein [Veillonella sp.]
MNKIFKVIWSKSKQCYVVVSEMAKNKTGKKKIVVASILAALAIQTAGVIDVAAAAGDQPSRALADGRVTNGKTNGLAIGNFASSESHQSIAIGYYSVANAAEIDPALPATAVGAGAHATGQSTVALGLLAQATSGKATALGSKSVASEDAAVAVGSDAKATGGYASALGADATASNNDATAFGHGTVASGASSTALGSRAKSGGVGGVGIGMLANATNQYGVAIGGYSSSTADNSIAIGRNSSVTGENGIAIGTFTNSKGANGVAVGTNGTTSELGGVAVGQAAKANKFNSVAMGMKVTADGDNSVALGGSASANSDGTIAIGSYGSTPTKATGNRALAIGSATTANGLESIAIGSRVNSTSQHSIAIGTGSNASAVKSVAIGPDSRATVDGGVALGRDSVADVAGGTANKGYNPNTNRTDVYSGLNGNVLTSTTGAVSIGNGSTVTRQLTGLAAGTRDTDAVNVAQLKSVNLAFSGNVNTGNVNIAKSTLGLKGDNTYITTSANGQNLTISGKTQNIDVTNGQASANATGMADSKNVAEAINKAISANAYHWKLAADRDSSAPEVINKSDTVIFGGDNNITVTRSGKKITTSLNKAITVDTVKANNSVTVSSGGNQITLDGTNGSVKGRNFTGDSFKAGDNVLSNTTLQIGPTTGSNNVTITRDGLTAKTATKTVKFGTDAISAGGQQITNVSSGGNIGTNAANITDVKNAVDAVTLKLDTNSKTGTVKLSESPLKVIGANGIRTDLVGTNNGSLVVGLDNNTVNATTKGIGLTGDTGSTGLKYLKDGDATFKVAGDGDLVTTKASATGVQVAVDSAKVKDLAVGAVTVSKANTTDNPITITPTAGTNTKDYAIGIDTTKLANQTQLTYKANGANANKVSLANGLNFTDGTFTKATVGTNGTVTISTATETITNDADGKAKVNSPTDGLATAKNVADSINKAVDGLSQNLTVSDGATDGTVNLKNQKLTISGTNGVTTTVNGQTVTVGLDATTKTKVDNASTAVARNISLGADSGTASSQSLKDGDVAFNVKAATGDLVSTKMNGNTVEISTKRAAITSDANTGAASVTGDDGLATSKNVADAINKAADAAKAGAAWNLTTNSSTTDKTTVQGGDTVDLINGDNILITQDGTDKKKITVATKKDLTVDSITAGNTVMNTSGLTNGTTAITGTGITTDKVTVGGISIDKTDGINGGNKTITNVASGGTTDTNAANIGDVKQAVANLSQNLNITDGTNNGTIDLKNQKLNVAGANGVTATVNNQTITVGLDDNTVNATTKGIGLTGDTGSTGNKYLKDGDVSFAVVGDGNLVSTSATATGVKVAVDAAKVKDLAVDAVTVSKDAQADNPITVTPTAGTNSKDYAIGIDTTKLAGKTDLTYRANNDTDANAQKVSLAKGLNFINGDTTVATVAADGKVSYDINTATKTKINDAATAVARNISLGADSGTASSQSLKDGDIAFNVKGATGDFISTKMNGDTVEVSTKRATINSDAAGTASVTGDDGLATAKNVADAINKAAKASSDAVNLKFSGDTNTSAGVVNLKDDTFGIKGDGKYVTTDADGKNLTVKVSEEEVKKSAVGAVTVSTDTTDANNPLTVTGTTSADGTTKDYKVTIDSTKVAAKTNLSYKANDGTAKQVSLADGLNFKDGTLTTATIDNAGVVKYDVKTAAITAGTDGTVTGPATDGVATAKNVADAINAAKKATKTEITANDGEAADATTGNVTLTSSAAADGHTIYDVKLNDKVTLGTGANAVTIDGTTGTITGKTANIGGVTVDGTNKYVTGLGNTTWNGTATTGRAATEDQLRTVADAAKASTDAINLKFAGDTNTSAGVVNLKDDTLGIKGDGKYVTTDADGKNLTVKVSEAEVKKSAVSAVTVSTDTTDADNPLTVTGTPSADGTTKDYKVTIDGTKVATKTKMSYKANDGTAKQVSLADGLNFKDGTLTTATIDDAGVVKYDVKTAAITAGTDGTITGPATDGVATAKNVADAINAAKKASKTEITANDDEAANATTGNVKLTSTTAADGHTVYNVKLNDTLTFGTGANAIVIDGTAGKATIGSAAIDGVNNTITTGGNKAVTLDGTTGTITGKAANIGGVTVDGTNNHVTGLANTTWDGNAVSGRAATEDQLKVVADAAANQTWQITADKDATTSGKQTGTKSDAKVGKDAKVTMIAGENITINQNGRDFTYSLNKDLVNMNSASFNGTGNNTTVINGDSITQTAGTQTNTSTAAGNTVADGTKSTATTADGTKITDGTKTNTSTADSTVIDDGNGNNTALTKDGVTITASGKDPVSLTKDGLNNGGNKISNIADGTDDTDAVNVRQLESKSKASKTELTANGGESAGSTTGNIVLTKTTAADGHIIYDNKLNDKVTLGTDPSKAVTVDGTTGTIKAGKDGNAVAINGIDGTIKAGDGANAVAIDGKNGSVKAGDKIALDGKDGKATIGTVGIDGKDGIITTGGNNPVAVNGKDGVVTGLTNKTWDPNNIASGRAATEDQVKSAVENAGWNATIGTEGSGINSTPTATAEKVKTDETVTFKAGNNMMVSQAGKTISYAVNPELKDMKSATFKDAAGNTTVTDGNGITITPGSANPNNPNAGTISLTKDGLNNGNNQLKGIAPGTDDTDAVNVSQLKASNARIGDAIGQVAGEVQRVGAHAAAMAALKPIQYDPLEPTQVMAGVGNYRGETAAALGLAHYTNEDTMFNVGVSLGANRNMVNAGVTHKFGSSPEKKNIPDRYKAGPISSVYVMQDEVSSLKKENSEQKTVIADQAARLNMLEAENERQRQELAETKQGLEDLRAAVSQLLASKG